MTITEIRLTPADDGPLAYGSMVLDGCLAVHGLKVIDGERGPFLAMPSERVLSRCTCGGKNHLKANFCNSCGARLRPAEAERFYADLVHPITADFRRMLTAAVLDSYAQRVRVLGDQQPLTRSNHEQRLVGTDGLRVPGAGLGAGQDRR